MYCESYNPVYFERFSVVLGYFPKASCAKHLLVTKSSFLRKWALTLVFEIFNISETSRIKDRKKSIIHFFLGTKCREWKNILRALRICIVSGFKLYITIDNCWQSQRRTTISNYYGGSYEGLQFYLVKKLEKQ